MNNIDNPRISIEKKERKRDKLKKLIGLWIFKLTVYLILIFFYIINIK
jgi:hypothetical protein